jgi:putative nucleotidyltransferase-like protein
VTSGGSGPGQLRVEHRLLFACIRNAFGRLDEPVGIDGLDWARFASLAGRQAVSPLVDRGLPADLPVPCPARRILHDGSLASSLHQQVIIKPALGRTLEALDEAGLQPVVLKGAALAWTVYREASLRTFADLDLLLPSEQIGRAAEVLTAHGWRSRGVGPANHHHLPALLTADGRAAVELHHRLLPAKSPYRLDPGRLRARARRSVLAGREALVLGPVDALHHACLHLAWADRYGRYPLRGLVDVLALATADAPELDWADLVQTVEAAASTGSVYWPLRLSRCWLGAPIPEWVLDRLVPPRPLRRLIAGLYTPSLLLDDSGPTDSGEQTLTRLLVQLSLLSGCRPADQLRELWATLVPPRLALTGDARQAGRSWLAYLAYLLDARRATPVLQAARRRRGLS